jgi:hypothetical protein
MGLYAPTDLINPTWSAARNGGVLSSSAGAVNATTGMQFNVTQPNISCVGVRFYSATSAAKTVKVKLYDAAGTLLSSSTVATNALAVFEVFFPGQALTPFALYRACIWDQAGASYYFYAPASANAPARPFYAGGVLVVNNPGINGAGDVAPTTNASGTEFYPVEPILVGA